MAYSLDYRKRAIELYKERKNKTEVSQILNISLNTLRSWLILSKNKNLRARKPGPTKPRKLVISELLKYVKANNTDTLEEIASEFNCSKSNIEYHLKANNYSFKKKKQNIWSVMKKND